jgi:DNA-binding response OmpR family regulator
MDSYQAIQKFKSQPQGQKTIIITLTASVLEEQKQQILKSGCDNFVRKPFDSQEILEMMGNHLEINYIYQTDEKDSLPISDESINLEDLKYLSSEWLQKFK